MTFNEILKMIAPSPLFRKIKELCFNALSTFVCFPIFFVLCSLRYTFGRSSDATQMFNYIKYGKKV